MTLISIFSKRKTDILKILFGISFAGIVIFLTYKTFMDFRDRWSKAATFKYTVRSATLPIRCMFIDPDQLGVKEWHEGDYSLYKLKSNTEELLISFQVVSSVEAQNGKKLYWIRNTGLKPSGIEYWRLVNQRSFQRKDEVKSFDYVDGSIPVPNERRKHPALSYKTIFNKIGNEVIETEVGVIQCSRYLASLVSEDGESQPLLELWGNPNVRPLGIVRARWQDTYLEIVEKKLPSSWDLPKVLNTQLEMKKSDSDNMCVQCHVDGIGGKDIRIYNAGYVLNSAEIDLTESLFHQLQSGMIQTGAALQLGVISKHRRRGQDQFVQFTWRKGNFWVKSDERDKVSFSMDTTLFHGHLRAIPHQGRLDLVWKTQ